MKKSESYHWITSMVVPRPIAVVSTINLAGQTNLAPFSFFNLVSASPAIVMFSVNKKRDGIDKDTIRNLSEVPEMVIHIAGEKDVGEVDAAGEEFSYGDSEIEKLGLLVATSALVRPPRVMNFGIALECAVHKILPIGSCDVVFAEVKTAHIREDLVGPAGSVLADRLMPLSRMGREGYAGIRLLGVQREN